MSEQIKSRMLDLLLFILYQEINAYSDGKLHYFVVAFFLYYYAKKILNVSVVVESLKYHMSVCLRGNKEYPLVCIRMHSGVRS